MADKAERDMTLVGDELGRQRLEKRSKWLRELRTLVEATSLPIVGIASQMEEPEAIMSILGRGRRASTIRRRVIDWKKASRYFMLTCGDVWPTGPTPFVDYLSVLATGGGGRAVLERALRALAFMEAVGGVAEGHRLSKNGLLTSAVDELSLHASAETRAKRKAPQVPIASLVGFEIWLKTDLVYVRMYAWFRLLRVWASLHFDDHRGLVPKLLHMAAGALRGTLVRTKTSGLGR